MHRFWEKVIKPVLIAAKPSVIVEVGSLSGKNTFKLLDYGKHCKAQCVVVEPAPQFDVELLQLIYGDGLKLMRQLSLEALPLIERYDVLLLDGDHNWYTVYNELKQAERTAVNMGTFPIVMLHDTQWPYGRRDMYYFPSSIPESMRQPHALKGIEAGKSELLESGGWNATVHNALHEHGERNGVLTAIEDFMRESPFKLKWYQLYSNNGLGMIVPDDHPILDVLDYILDTSGL
ncbi:class I SAM-dependent methyltransferase [Paenibacillus hemerocallicola]|uniref:Class I SAM-dependent methyltransferase n=1 Tax=Paenibacillus hemerocallicola TaxID=1172614 RepID=A0A5C4TBB8_9BACL|nr:class I SAM-dependent methyltransferase [Paenibacillus hemerocallicola]TNJ66205.1 class I SAM-dependent methyltransferase [Paenibacillus hemerocallicola]